MATLKKRMAVLAAAGLLAGIATIGLMACSPLLTGDYKFQMGDYPGAITDLTTYLETHPDSFQARYMLGRTYLESGDPEAAADTLREALDLKPGDPEATVYLGLAHVARNDYENAIAVFESFQDKSRPMVEKEVRQQLTLLKIAQSKKLAKEAVQSEKELAGLKPDQNTYAVCYYADKTADQNLQAFRKALAAMTISNLSQIKSIRVVERLRLQALLEEMALGQTGIIDPSTAPRTGRLLGAENLVTGILSRNINAVTALASTSRGKVVGNSAVQVDRDRFFELPGAIAANVAEIKNISLTPAEKKAIGGIHTRNLDAAVYYGQALEALDVADWKTALTYFNKALAADPEFELAALGRESCPDDSSEGKGGFATLSPQQVKSRIDKDFNDAVKAQEEADDAAEESLSGGGGGH